MLKVKHIPVGRGHPPSVIDGNYKVVKITADWPEKKESGARSAYMILSSSDKGTVVDEDVAATDAMWVGDKPFLVRLWETVRAFNVDDLHPTIQDSKFEIVLHLEPV